MAKTPWHIWVVGLVTLLWHAGGAFDYVMSATRNPDYLAAMTAEQLAFLDAFPAWTTFFWALAIWGAVLVSILILARSRFAAPVAVVALVSMLIVTVRNLFLADPSALELMGAFQAGFTVVIIVVSVLLVLYTRAQVANGHLR